MVLGSLFPRESYVEPTAGGANRLTLPKHWVAIPSALGLMLFLAGWVFMGVQASNGVPSLLRALRPDPPLPVPILVFILVFLLAWVTAWIVWGAWVFMTLIWLVAGRERVWVEQGTLLLEQVVGPVGRRRRYDLRQVTGLRVVLKTRDDLVYGAMMLFGFGRYGSLAFEYGSRTVWWGGGLDDTEARAVVEWLDQQDVSRTVQAVSTTDAPVRARPRRLLWRQWAAWLIAVPFGVAVIVHVLTFVGVHITEKAGDAVMLGAFPALFFAWPAMVLHALFTSTKSSDLPLSREPNPWALYLAIGIAIYAAVNFTICGALMEWAGSPERTATGYVLTNHGEIIQALTEAEYWRMRAYELRLFTGHLLVFWGWPMLYFFSVDPRRTRKSGRGQA